MQENEQRPQPAGETRPQLERMERSASQAALQALETVATGAEYTLGALAATGAAMKIKSALT
jgi:hypothetical protein